MPALPLRYKRSALPKSENGNARRSRTARARLNARVTDAQVAAAISNHRHAAAIHHGERARGEIGWTAEEATDCSGVQLSTFV